MSLIPPQTEEIRKELQKDNRRLLHCLNCGGQLVAIRHSSYCLRCDSEAIVVEHYD
jgi:predicted Zn-ribbon and HTH transcriptional regulator